MADHYEADLRELDEETKAGKTKIPVDQAQF